MGGVDDRDIHRAALNTSRFASTSLRAGVAPDRERIDSDAFRDGSERWRAGSTSDRVGSSALDDAPREFRIGSSGIIRDRIRQILSHTGRCLFRSKTPAALRLQLKNVAEIDELLGQRQNAESWNIQIGRITS